VAKFGIMSQAKKILLEIYHGYHSNQGNSVTVILWLAWQAGRHVRCCILVAELGTISQFVARAGVRIINYLGNHGKECYSLYCC
jgi:hypothetical protein